MFHRQNEKIYNLWTFDLKIIEIQNDRYNPIKLMQTQKVLTQEHHEPVCYKWHLNNSYNL